MKMTKSQDGWIRKARSKKGSFNPRLPVCTRDGRAAFIEGSNRSHFEGSYRYPILARVEHPNEHKQWVRWHYMLDGRWKSNDPENGNDLVNYIPN